MFAFLGVLFLLSGKGELSTWLKSEDQSTLGDLSKENSGGPLPTSPSLLLSCSLARKGWGGRVREDGRGWYTSWSKASALGMTSLEELQP